MVQLDVYARIAGEDGMGDVAKTTFFLPEPICRSDIEQCFPFEGSFHFRYKLSRDDCRRVKKLDIREEFVWWDMIMASDEIVSSSSSSSSSSNIVEVQALMLSGSSVPAIEAEIDKDYKEYLQDIAMQLQDEGPREDRREIDRTLLSSVAAEKSTSSGKKGLLSKVLKSSTLIIYFSTYSHEKRFKGWFEDEENCFECDGKSTHGKSRQFGRTWGIFYMEQDDVGSLPNARNSYATLGRCRYILLLRCAFHSYSFIATLLSYLLYRTCFVVEVLSKLSDDADTPFDEHEQRHMEILEDVS